MKPVVPNPERMILESHRADSLDAGSTTRKEVIRASSERENALGALADHVVSTEHPADVEHPIQVERPVFVNQATSSDAIAGISGLIEYAVSAMITPVGLRDVKRTDDRLQAMPQGLVKKKLDEKLNCVKFESRLLRKFEEATTSRPHLKNMTAVM